MTKIKKYNKSALIMCLLLYAFVIRNVIFSVVLFTVSKSIKPHKTALNAFSLLQQ